MNHISTLFQALDLVNRTDVNAFICSAASVLHVSHRTLLSQRRLVSHATDAEASETASVEFASSKSYVPIMRTRSPAPVVCHDVHDLSNAPHPWRARYLIKVLASLGLHDILVGYSTRLQCQKRLR